MTTETTEKVFCRNPNHPAAGSSIRVEPVREKKDVVLIKKILADKPRDLAIFTMGINTNLRASDLLRITIGHVAHLRPGESFSIREKKTGKLRTITLNRTVHEALKGLLVTLDTSRENDFLFQSREKVHGGMLTVSYLNSLVKGWCRAINLRGNYGSHTLRKTWGYMHRTIHHTDIPTLMTMFNHSSQRQTLSYLCIDEDEIVDAYMKEI